MNIFAPILIEPYDGFEEVSFGDFVIRKLLPGEHEVFISSSIDPFLKGEIMNSAYCLSTTINDLNDGIAINAFSDSIKRFRICLRLVGAKINLSVYSLGPGGFYYQGIHTQASRANNPMMISEEILSKIKIYYGLLKDLSEDKHFQSLVERYEFACSCNQSHVNKFIDAVIVLESLLLPSSDRGELKLRLSLIAANLLSSELGMDKRKIYDQVKEYYRIRSEFVHNGRSSKYSHEKFDRLLDICRQLLVLYVEKPEVFGEKNLEDLLL